MIEYINEIKIIINKNIIQFDVSNDTNIVDLVILLKSSLNLTRIIPQSIYSITKGSSGEIIKKKKSISFFRKNNIFKLLDTTFEADHDSYKDSGDHETNAIVGWEIRFIFLIDKQSINELKQIHGNFKGLIENEEKIIPKW